jgi:hypothetical protein
MGRPERKPWEAMLRVRHVDAAGRMVPLGSEGPHTSFWAERYDGRFGHVYFGHQPWKRATEPVRFPHATGIDLGACFGNLLACAVLEQGAPPRFVSVPGHRPPEGV